MLFHVVFDSIYAKRRIPAIGESWVQPKAVGDLARMSCGKPARCVLPIQLLPKDNREKSQANQTGQSARVGR
jgi:hypothetical protein